MPQVGDEVVTMSTPGIFKVIAVDGPTLTIENSDGIRKLVLHGSVRTLEKRGSN